MPRTMGGAAIWILVILVIVALVIWIADHWRF